MLQETTAVCFPWFRNKILNSKNVFTIRFLKFIIIIDHWISQVNVFSILVIWHQLFPIADRWPGIELYEMLVLDLISGIECMTFVFRNFMRCSRIFYMWFLVLPVQEKNCEVQVVDMVSLKIDKKKSTSVQGKSKKTRKKNYS